MIQQLPSLLDDNYQAQYNYMQALGNLMKDYIDLQSQTWFLTNPQKTIKDIEERTPLIDIETGSGRKLLRNYFSEQREDVKF